MRTIYTINTTNIQHDIEEYHWFFTKKTLKSENDLPKGVPTLLTHTTKQKLNHDFINGWYDTEVCYCRNCKNYFTRPYKHETDYNYTLKNQSIQCPNCEKIHKPERIMTGPADTLPVYIKINFYQTNNEILVLDIYGYPERVKYAYPTVHEMFRFDIKNKKTVWKQYNENKETTIYSFNQFLTDLNSSVTRLIKNNTSDNNNNIETLCQIICSEINNEREKLNLSKLNLKLNKNKQENLLLCTIFNIARLTSFNNAPIINCLGTNKDLYKWSEEQGIYELHDFIDIENKIYKIQQNNPQIDYKTAFLELKNENSEILKENFTIKNYELLQKIKEVITEPEEQENIFKLLMNQKEPFHNEHGKSKMNITELALKLCKIYKENIPEAEPTTDFITTIINYCKENKIVYYHGDYTNYYNQYKDITHDIATQKGIFQSHIKLLAKKEKKEYYQKLSEYLKVPNTKAFRENYDYELIDLIQKIYKYYTINIANDLLSQLKPAYETYKTNQKNNQHISNYNTAFRRNCTTIYNYHTPINYAELSQKIIEFYDTFNSLYPKIITPKYAANYILNEKNFGSDCTEMYNKLKKQTKTKFNQNKPRLKELHEELMKLLNLEENENIQYKFSPKTIRKYETTINQFKFEIVKEYSQLLDIANILNNCSAKFKDQIGDNHFIVIIKKNNKTIAEVEIKEAEIYEAKLKNNQRPKDNEEINNLILDYAEKTKLRLNAKNDINIPQVA